MQAGLLGTIGLSSLKDLGGSFKSQSAEISRLPLQRRKLGRTGEELSIVGLGGMVVQDKSAQQTQEIVRQTLAQGINYFDVAPSHGDAEELIGLALSPVRDKVFLACNTQKRDRAGADEELNKSLQRLRTDYLDLYQMRALMDVREVNQALGRGGAIEAFLQAKEAGKIKNVGFSAHSREAALRALELYDFDTIMFPVNYVSWFGSNFGPEVVLQARSRDMGILAIKALARQPWPDEGQRQSWPKAWYQPVTAPEEMDLALRFTLSQSVTATVPPGDIRLFSRAVEIARDFTSLNDRESRHLRRLSASLTSLF